MATTRRLHDELPSRQEQQCRQYAVDNLDDTPNDEDIAWGSDPFDILAHREEHGQSNHD